MRRRMSASVVFVFAAPGTTEIYTLSLHDALPIYRCRRRARRQRMAKKRSTLNPACGLASPPCNFTGYHIPSTRSEEHTSELQSRENLVCRLLLEKKKRHLSPASRFRYSARSTRLS